MHSRVACGSQTFGGRAVLCASDAFAMDRPRKGIDHLTPSVREFSGDVPWSELQKQLRAARVVVATCTGSGCAAQSLFFALFSDSNDSDDSDDSDMTLTYIHCIHCIRSRALKLRGISLAADRRGHASHRAGSIDTHLQAHKKTNDHRVIEQLPEMELVAQMRREVKWTCYQESYKKLEIVKRMNQIE